SPAPNGQDQVLSGGTSAPPGSLPFLYDSTTIDLEGHTVQRAVTPCAKGHTFCDMMALVLHYDPGGCGSLARTCLSAPTRSLARLVLSPERWSASPAMPRRLERLPPRRRRSRLRPGRMR